MYKLHIYFIHIDKDGNRGEITLSFDEEKQADKEFKRIIKAIRKDKVVKLSSHKCAIPTSQIFMVTQTERE